MKNFSQAFSADQMHEGRRSEKDFDLIRESPIEILVEGVHVAALFRTPGREEDLAAGVCVGAGILQNREELKTVIWDPETHPGSIELVVEKNALERALALFSQSQNNLTPPAANDDLGTAELLSRKIDGFPSNAPFSGPDLQELSRHLKENQNIHHLTRSAHGVIIFDGNLSVLGAAEDVGRHNALDKAVGQVFLSGSLPDACAVLLSCRINHEVVEKCANAGIFTLVSISRPTSLAVHMARSLNMTLALSTNDEGLFVFSGKDRIT